MFKAKWKRQSQGTHPETRVPAKTGPFPGPDAQWLEEILQNCSQMVTGRVLSVIKTIWILHQNLPWDGNSVKRLGPGFSPGVNQQMATVKWGQIYPRKDQVPMSGLDLKGPMEQEPYDKCVFNTKWN